jgi:hypothetical protein
LSSAHQTAAYSFNCSLAGFLDNAGARVLGKCTVVAEDVCERLFNAVCAEIAEIDLSSSSEIAESLRIWPLTKPGLVEAAEENGIAIEDLVDAFLHEFSPSLSEILDNISSFRHVLAIRQIKNVRTQFMLRPALVLLARELCPLLLDEVFELESSAGMLKMKRALRLVDKCDSAVHAIASQDLMDLSFLWRIIQLELSCLGPNDEFLLFRCSAGPSADSTVGSTGEPHSLSFGMSVFAGIRFDRSASVFDLARKPSQCPDVYALKLSIKEYMDPNCIIFVPPLPPLLQISGLGELFHPRTKVWVSGKQEFFVSGLLHCSLLRLPDFLRSPIPTESTWQAIAASSVTRLRSLPLM